MPQGTCQRNVRRGFTLIELLVVIGIIVILVGILLPVVSTMRKRAQFADTTAELTRIATAIQNYYQDFRSYPGPIPDSQIYGYGGTAQSVTPSIPPAPTSANSPLTSPTVATVTSSENLVLGLMGGLQLSSGGAVQYNVNMVNHGPQSLNALAPQQMPSYYDASNVELITGAIATTATTNIGYTAWTPTQGSQYTTPSLVVPELMDHFSNPHPIIYLKAIAGAGGNGTAVCDTPRGGSSPGSQYFSFEVNPYWRVYSNTVALASPTLPTASAFSTPDANNNRMYPTAVSFFQNPTIVDGFTPRSKDSFILISAGYDGIYGTTDDVIISN